jgi:hypothetical protein
MANDNGRNDTFFVRLPKCKFEDPMFEFPVIEAGNQFKKRQMD